ncbi:BTAD domain-containing putative transcriptional regulator [Kitasatospora sp. NPDC006697]|uniref:AfsR/SARP family transcriptional regulator n=1 Tax=Kitasatospora sp. NPDC006697 TaxID=3364020 RepID=UPI0036B91105
MEIKVLGPLEVREGRLSVVPTAGKPRQVLALLALNAGRAVPVAALIEELWGPQPPRSAPSVLQTYILQLRRLVEAGVPEGSPRTAKEILETRHNSYLLNVEPQLCDIQESERLAAAGRRALADGREMAASELLRAALALWRGPVLADVKAGPRLSIEVTRLEEGRTRLIEEHIDADLLLGRHQDLLGELAGLCAQYPWHENLHAKYMIALYRSGRQWQALEVYRRLHSALVEEFGLEPSGRLRRLQRAVLRSDPALEPDGRHGIAEPVAV